MEKKHILIVDDDTDIRNILHFLLKKEGYLVSEAENGRIALEMIKKEAPDLVLLDIEMPLMSGYEVCNRLREDLRDTATYVIVVSARGEVSDKIKGLNTGVDSYFTKPFNREELLAQIKVGLSTSEQRRGSLTDPLTGLPNRLAFNNILTRDIASSQRYGASLSLAIVDLDNFKAINDTYGHTVGDVILVEVVQIFRQATRASDLFARWGGDEFISILPGTTLDSAEKVMNTIRSKIEKHVFPEIGQGRLTSSMGVTELREGDLPVSFFKRADDALYRAKQEGGNHVVVV